LDLCRRQNDSSGSVKVPTNFIVLLCLCRYYIYIDIILWVCTNLFPCLPLSHTLLLSHHFVYVSIDEYKILFEPNPFADRSALPPIVISTGHDRAVCAFHHNNVFVEYNKTKQ